MYNNELRLAIIDNLESKVGSIINTCVTLASQGYLINKAKHIRVELSSMLIHAFENINVLSEEQQNKIENLFNKIEKL